MNIYDEIYHNAFNDELEKIASLAAVGRHFVRTGVRAAPQAKRAAPKAKRLNPVTAAERLRDIRAGRKPQVADMLRHYYEFA